eukprot:TRINITY_DN6694_c0_g1_i2.p3 TRINITY_DN6694_c0_g1~~TRINITY_DN6694_c0_g1_i2.p3  ORF type:complete len:135 (-),score=34.91 TRINITY_DN6694_c0_g1_i2:168-572(-)
MRFASGGSDGLVKYWTYNAHVNKFASETILTANDWVRDLSFAHSESLGTALADWAGNSKETLAVVTEGSSGIVMRRTAKGWTSFELPVQNGAAKISWDTDTSDLAVVYLDGTTKTFEEDEPGVWKEIEDSPLQF